MLVYLAPNDLEPLDERERCEAAWGNYRIGRFDESRDQFALLFDPRRQVGGEVEAGLEHWL